MADLTIVTATDLAWTNAAHTAFSCNVTFQGMNPIPYHAVQGDSVAHGAELFTRGVAGDFGTIVEYVAPAPAVPKTVTAAQGGIALINANLMTAVQSVINAADTPPSVTWAWTHAPQWQRTSAALAYVAGKAGITDAQMDALFTAAAQVIV